MEITSHILRFSNYNSQNQTYRSPDKISPGGGCFIFGCKFGTDTFIMGGSSIFGFWFRPRLSSVSSWKEITSKSMKSPTTLFVIWYVNGLLIEPTASSCEEDPTQVKPKIKLWCPAENSANVGRWCLSGRTTSRRRTNLTDFYWDLKWS